MTDELAQLFDPIERALDRLSINAVFGQPTKEGDVTIIPVAQIGAAFGYGYGSGGREGEKPEGGGGGGMRGTAKPCGFVKLTSDGVYYEPTFNPMLIPLAGIALAAWMVFWIAMVARAIIGGRSKRLGLLQESS